MYPLPQNEPARLDALYVLSVLDTPPEPHFDAVSRTASALFGVPIALVSLIDRDRQWFKARCGLDVEGTSREAAFCTYTILSDDVLVVEDATTDERFRDNPLVTGAPGIRFYAGAPLIMGPGIRVGTLCVIDTAPRSFTAEQRFQLADLAQTITALLRLNQSRAVAEAEIAARREREPFLSSVLNASSDCIKVVENDGSLTFMNANGLCAMEIECFADVRGAEWAALWPSEARSQVCAAIETAKQGSMARFEAFCPTAKGTPKWWDVTVSPVTNKDGHVTRLISISRDVTERYLSSQALARNEERLRLALEATGLGIWDIDPRTGERNWSTGLRDILGYGEDVVPARAAFLERLHPEDRA
ncbi:MAG TPA: PAS domain-containing protein, partial [Salinarimonas sp.]|nr:PAS domain-containing protein [Salinarimonas sp.]